MALFTQYALFQTVNPYLAEESSACWLDDDCIAVAASDKPEEDEVESDVEPRLRPHGLAVYDVTNRTCLRVFQFDESPGTILALGTRHVLSLYRHPKLIDLSTGKVIHVWTERKSRSSNSIRCGAGRTVARETSTDCRTDGDQYIGDRGHRSQ